MSTTFLQIQEWCRTISVIQWLIGENKRCVPLRNNSQSELFVAIFTSGKKVWGNVMFLHMSVILSTGGWGGDIGFPACIRDHMIRGAGSASIRGLHLEGGVCIHGGVCIWGDRGLHPREGLHLGVLPTVEVSRHPPPRRN